MKDGGDFAVERREATLVIADAFPVDPDVGSIVCGADVQEGACARPGIGGEVTLVPNDALVVEELRHLGVPIAGDLHGGSCREIVLVVMRSAGDVRVSIFRVGGVVDGAIRSVEGAGWSLVDEVVPVSIQAGDGAMIDTDEQRLERLLSQGEERAGEVQRQDRRTPVQRKV